MYVYPESPTHLGDGVVRVSHCVYLTHRENWCHNHRGLFMLWPQVSQTSGNQHVLGQEGITSHLCCVFANKFRSFLGAFTVLRGVFTVISRLFHGVLTGLVCPMLFSTPVVILAAAQLPKKKTNAEHL